MNLDRYTLQARVLPVYIVLLPLGLAFTALYPGSSFLGLLGTITVAPAVLAALTAQLGRDAGSRRQPELWDRWGGPPTTQLLRHRGIGNPVLRSRYHARLRHLLPEMTLPTPEEEAHDPVAADHAYEACVRYLIGRTRDIKHFSLVFKENVSYGFRRNLWALKPFGVAFSVIAVAATSLRIWSYRSDFLVAPAELLLVALMSLGLLLVWVFWISPEWVRIAADAYAARLLEACEQLNAE